jgi:hypothetical protein
MTKVLIKSLIPVECDLAFLNAMAAPLTVVACHTLSDRSLIITIAQDLDAPTVQAVIAAIKQKILEGLVSGEIVD